MNDISTAKLKMYINVLNTCNRNQEAWSTIPAFNNSYNAFSEKVSKINEINKQLKNTSKSTTEAKKQQKNLMIDNTMVLVGAIRAYVSVSKNTALAEVAALTRSAIMKSKEIDADDICMNVVDKAKGVMKQLADFGTTKAEIDAAIASIQGFSKMIGKPKEDILVNKSFNEQLSNHIKEADNILNQELDGLMLRFKTSKEVFYNEYNAAKKLGVSGGKKEETPTPSSKKSK